MLIPANAELILRSLEEAGHEAYIVGGCVRDALLGREPQDWDITTSALPEQVQALFRRTIDTGIQHGTVTVMFGKEAYEVTTYRIDGEYHDGRHPDQVTFTRSLEEDLKRRDFTINAMAYNPKRGLVDLFGGQKDLAERVIRAVGDARERFSEDALRMLRAVRFAGQLGFAIEEGTLAGIRALAPTLAKISQERIREELTKLLLSPQPELLETAIDTGMTAVILPEADRMRASLPEAYRAIRALREEALSEREMCALHYALVFAGAGGACEMCRRLKFDNETVQMTKMLADNEAFAYTGQLPEIRRLLHRLGQENVRILFAFQRAAAAGRDDADRLRNISLGEEACRQVLAAGDCYELKDLAVSGADLIAAGFAPGKALGQTLNRLLEAVMDDPAMNRREQLLAMTREEKIQG
ncbi:MAG: CCA tRNA nucleotidyltransferase [Lachnospiraceae bacterium]|nr:CCA tRNA nucleotidyltransferase [Lachnospiraceae bacterium]